MALNKLRLHNVLERSFGGLGQAQGGCPDLLLVEPTLRLGNVIDGGILREEVQRLSVVKLLCRSQEERFKVALVHIGGVGGTEFEEHANVLLQQGAIVGEEASPFGGDRIEQELSDAGLNAGMFPHDGPEQMQTQLINWPTTILGNMRPIHVHQNISHHDHCDAICVRVGVDGIQRKR